MRYVINKHNILTTIIKTWNRTAQSTNTNQVRRRIRKWGWHVANITYFREVDSENDGSTDVEKRMS